MKRKIRRNVRTSGFTLLELMLVVFILSVIVGVASVSMRSGYLETAIQSDAELLSEAIAAGQNYARTHYCICRLRIDRELNQYYLETAPALEKPFAPLKNSIGMEVSLQEGVFFSDFRSLNRQNRRNNEIFLYATGETDAAVIVLETAAGERRTIETGALFGEPDLR